jgi:PilZ domain-containing protein
MRTVRPILCSRTEGLFNCAETLLKKGWADTNNNIEEKNGMKEALLRQRKRFNVCLPVRMYSPFNSHSGGAYHYRNIHRPTERSVTHNLSSTGCYFLLSRELPLGTLIDLEIEIPALQPIPRGVKVYCRAKVVRVDATSQPGKIGIACMIEEYRFSRSRKVRSNDRAA